MPKIFPFFSEKIFSIPKDIVSFILNPELGGIFLYIKIIFMIISLAIFIGIIVLLLRTTWLKRYILEDLTETFTARPYGAKKTFKQWITIQKRLGAEREDEYKLALIEADSLLDDILKQMGYTGETMGDRLKQLSSTILPNIDEVWQAHKIRNNIVHDPDYKLSLDLVKRALAIYEKAFQNLEAF